MPNHNDIEDDDVRLRAPGLRYNTPENREKLEDLLRRTTEGVLTTARMQVLLDETILLCGATFGRRCIAKMKLREEANNAVAYDIRRAYWIERIARSRKQTQTEKQISKPVEK